LGDAPASPIHQRPAQQLAQCTALALHPAHQSFTCTRTKQQTTRCRPTSLLNPSRTCSSHAAASLGNNSTDPSKDSGSPRQHMRKCTKQCPRCKLYCSPWFELVYEPWEYWQKERLGCNPAAPKIK
jgi:hypothetical protein